MTSMEHTYEGGLESLLMTSNNTPQGWYDDGQGAIRWWDGNQWTQHTHNPDRSGPGAAQNAPTQTAAAVRSAGAAASEYARKLVEKDDPSTDPDAIWAAVGKPVTGLGGGRYKLTSDYLYFEKGTLSTSAQQILTHEIYDVDARQTMTQKARGVGTIVLFAVRSGSGVREMVELIDIANFREGVTTLNRVSHEARERLRLKNQTQHINYTGLPTAPVPVAAAPASAAEPAVDLNAELAKLASFKEQGILDDDEFAAAKRKLLGL